MQRCNAHVWQGMMNQDPIVADIAEIGIISQTGVGITQAMTLSMVVMIGNATSVRVHIVKP